jgi:ATP-dependent 26S proteasome regulatory subunit
LATNLRANIDDAFARRLDAVVDFPMPAPEHRLRLWELSLGPLVPRAGDVDLEFCAEAFELSGGNIRNIALTAAHVAAAGDRAVGMRDLIHGTRREYRKLGRLLDAAEFGRYHGLAEAREERDRANAEARERTGYTGPDIEPRELGGRS